MYLKLESSIYYRNDINITNTTCRHLEQNSHSLVLLTIPTIFHPHIYNNPRVINSPPQNIHFYYIHHPHPLHTHSVKITLPIFAPENRA